MYGQISIFRGGGRGYSWVFKMTDWYSWQNEHKFFHATLRNLEALASQIVSHILRVWRLMIFLKADELFHSIGCTKSHLLLSPFKYLDMNLIFPQHIYPFLQSVNFHTAYSVTELTELYFFSDKCSLHVQLRFMEHELNVCVQMRRELHCKGTFKKISTPVILYL